MKIGKCNTYHARTVGTNLVRMPDGISVFKIYYVSVIGRDNPEKYEWEHSTHSINDFEKNFRAGNYEGIGFVTAFPHITKVFRFSPYGETILDLREYNTKDMSPKDCTRSDGSHEFACYAEAVLSADEYTAWAGAETVEEYISFWGGKINFPIVSNRKLACYWNKDWVDQPISRDVTLE